jgi:hypothetical protein
MAVIKIVPMPGAVGDKGDEGAVGPRGQQGETGLQGPAGADALWSYNGEYNPGAGYAVGDVVTYDGQLWYRKNSNGGNVGDTPSEGLFWDLLAAKGADGEPGLNGLEGEQGPAGADGASAYDIAVENGFVGTEQEWLDSIGGGGWGPVVSSTLIASGKNPRLVVGSVNLAEFFVSLASSFTFFTILGASHWQTIVGLILGGVCAAPLAANLSRRLNIKAMMLLVGIVVIIVSLRIIIISIIG